MAGTTVNSLKAKAKIQKLQLSEVSKENEEKTDSQCQQKKVEDSKACYVGV